MRVWWSRSPAPGNFGDVLTPAVLRAYGIPHEYQTLRMAEAICIGSIARFARSGMLVMGSGAISRADRLDPDARYAFVRGPITAAMVRKHGGSCPDVYGDPAMLLPRFIGRDTSPDIEVAAFPHYIDLDLCGQFRHVINPLQSPMSVLKQIWRCRRIVSSSLHGIIVAHAYGIPAAWVQFGGELAGDGTKFHDYAQSVGMDEMPLSTPEKPVFTLPQHNTDGIHEIMRSISGH